MAALMLGAAESQAVTSVGVNIQGSAYGYNAGAAVTQRAFGISPLGWFGTGTTGGTPGYNYGFTSGSMTVIPISGGPGFGFAWTSGEGNHNFNPWSGWSPADPSNMPGYTGYPGDYEAIYAFLSPAYSISLTGLNAQFPNGCVLQAVTGTDGGGPQSVVVTGSGAQTLTQTNLFTRSTGGPIYISAASTALTDDSVTLTPAGGAGREAISGVIITDKPVVTVPPAGGTYMAGPPLTLTSSVAALPAELSYQWRKNGTAISGANSATYTKAVSTSADSGNYDLVVTNLYGTATSAVATVNVVPIGNNLEVYYTFDSGTVNSTTVTDQWSDDGNLDNVGRSSLTTFTTGAKFGDALNVSTTGDTPECPTADPATINSTWLPGTNDYTLSFWYRQGTTGYNRVFDAGARGNDGNNDDGLQIYSLNGGGYEVAFHDPSIGSATRDTFKTGVGNSVFDGVTWNHFVLVRSGTSLRLWINGADVGGTTLSAGYNIAVGADTWYREPRFGPDQDTISGAAYDDCAIWHRALESAEIAQIWNGGTGKTINTLLNLTSKPSFSPAGGGYVYEQSVTLTSDSGSTIYYTTDGSDPTTSGTRSSGSSPITDIIVPADTTETIKAYATNSGTNDSAVASATYVTYSSATWTSLASGTWETTGNWAGGVLPNAPGINVDFSKLTLTGNTAVTSVSSASAGTLIFGDEGNRYSWGISGGMLTLDNGSSSPAITTLNTDVGIAATLTGTHGLFKDGPGTLTLSGSSSYSGTTTVYEGALIVSSRSGDVPYSVASNSTLKIGYSTGGGYASTNLKVYGAGVAATTGLYLNGGTSYNCSGQLQLLGAPTTIRQYGSGLAGIGTFDVNGVGLFCSSAASGSIIDANIQMVSRGYGMAMQVDAGANTATGDLIINGPLNVENNYGFIKRGGGSLVLNGVASSGNVALSIEGGTVICGTTNCIGANAALSINSGCVMALNGFNQTVKSLNFGGVQQASGRWGATGSGATHIDNTHFTGSGVVMVGTVPDFAAWALANAPGQSASEDHDNDGVSNGIEYFMGLSGSGFTANPGLVAGKVSWPKGTTYSGVYGVDYVVQTSPDLSTWTDVLIGDLNLNNGSPLEYTPPVGTPKSFTRLKVTGP